MNHLCSTGQFGRNVLGGTRERETGVDRGETEERVEKIMKRERENATRV